MVCFHEAGEPGDRDIQRLQQTLRSSVLCLFLRRKPLSRETGCYIALHPVIAMQLVGDDLFVTNTVRLREASAASASPF